MNWIDRVSDALTFFALFLSLTLAYPSRFNWFKTACLMILFTADAAGLVLLIDMLRRGSLIVYLVSFVLWGWVYAALVLTGPFPHKMAMASAFVSAGMLLTLLIRSLISLFAPGFPGIIARLISIPLLFLSGWFLENNAVHSQRGVRKDYAFGISLAAFSGLLAFAVIQIRLNRSSALAAALLSVCLLTALYSAFWLSSRLIARCDADITKLAVDAYAQGEQRTAQAVLRLADEMRSQRQETRDQWSALSALLNEGELEQARELLRNLIETPPTNSVTVCSGSAAADAVLNEKAVLAQALNIPMSIDAHLSDPLPIQTADLAALLGHLFNNALEASQLIEAPAINARIFSADNALCFLVRNRADTEALRKNPELTATDESPESLSLGLPVICAIAEKYDGRADFETEGDEFIARVTLPLKSSS